MVDRTQLFLQKIEVDPVRGCWLWIGHVSKVGGYGQFWDGERVVGAHVFSFRRFNGPLLPGLEPDHLCRVRRCVHPDHLEAITRRENLLRGDTIPALKAGQRDCIHGHQLSGDNVYFNSNGTRACRICRAASSLAWANANRERRRELDRLSYQRRTK